MTQIINTKTDQWSFLYEVFALTGKPIPENDNQRPKCMVLSTGGPQQELGVIRTAGNLKVVLKMAGALEIYLRN